MIDTRKYPCPEPSFQARLALRKMKDGEELTILEDKPECIKDLKLMCLMLDHTLVSVEDSDDGTLLTVKKGL